MPLGCRYPRSVTTRFKALNVRCDSRTKIEVVMYTTWSVRCSGRSINLPQYLTSTILYRNTLNLSIVSLEGSYACFNTKKPYK
jgi:hypothetical protein